MSGDYKTSEAQAFREHYDKLVDSIQEPDLPVLGARFFSRHIISRETMELVGKVASSSTRGARACTLMLAVMAGLDIHPDKFESALDAFREEPVYAEFSSMIKETYATLRFETHSSLTVTSSTKTMDEYKDYLKTMYFRSKLPIKGKWPPSPCKKIIKLAAIERKERSQQVAIFQGLESVDEYMQENSMIPVSMEDLLQTKDGSSPKIVVVQGVPGIGKSTFAWKFCRRWAKGKIYQQYDLVILLRMRDTRVREATQLSDLFFSEDREVSKNLAKDLCNNKGRGTLFLMEGIDELPASCLADDTLLSNLLQGLSLPKVTILVTTRPWSVPILTEKCGDQISRRVEILGFAREDILRYISYAFNDYEIERAKFMKYFHSHPQLESIMHIPLNAVFVVQIYQEFKHSDKDVPHTLTQLYTALVKGLLMRYLKSTQEFKELELTNLENISEPVNTYFEQLCLLAFMSFTTVNVKVTFTDAEAALYGCLDSLGLMQSSADLSIDTGTTVTHSFLHFTIQEFLAAYHLSKQPAQVQQLFLETHKSDNQFHMLIRFLIGLSSEVLRYRRESNESQSSEVSTIQLHWLFESQSPMAVSSYLGTGVVRYESLHYPSAFDLYALSYCLCYSNCSWRLRIEVDNLSAVHFPNTSFHGKVVHASLFLTNVSVSALQLFFSLPQSLFSEILSLYIFSNRDIDLAVANALKTNLQSYSLREFYLLTPHAISASIATIHSAFPNLTTIVLGMSNFNSTDMLQLCQYITSPTRSPNLPLVLCLTHDLTFTEDSGALLMSAVACSKSIYKLFLSQLHNGISLREIEMLAIALSSNCTLKHLSLTRCSIDDEGVEALTSGLEENKTLIYVDLSFNSIATKGAAALASMLEVNNTLEDLNLSNNKLIGTEGALRLIGSLEINKTLQKLILSSECEPVECGSIFLEHIRKDRIYFIQPGLEKV